MWRAQDDALLRRLENELVMEQLWQQQAGAAAELAADLPARAAGLIEALRGAAGAADEIEAEVADQRLWPKTLVGSSAPLLHHLAVFHRHLADARLARLERSRRAGRRDEAGQAKIGNVRGARYAAVLSGRCLSVACWLALRAEGSYLASLCRAVLPAADDAEIERQALHAVLAPVEALGAVARDGAAEGSLAAALALQTLVDLPHAIRISGCSQQQARPVRMAAERLHAAAVDDALAPISEAIDATMARGKAAEQGPAIMKRLARVWRWAGEDEHVERYVLNRVKPVAWNIYQQEPGYTDLRRLLSPLLYLLDHAGQRIVDDLSQLAYAAPCAQMFVFRSEMSEDGEESMRLAEYALRLCPTHRNARLILARLLTHEVRSQLETQTFIETASVFLNPKENFTALQAKLDRAEELYPECDGLPAARDMLAKARETSLFG